MLYVLIALAVVCMMWWFFNDNDGKGTQIAAQVRTEERYEKTQKTSKAGNVHFARGLPRRNAAGNRPW